MEGIKEEEEEEEEGIKMDSWRGSRPALGFSAPPGSLGDLSGIRETGTLGQIGRKILNSKEFLSMEYQSLVCIGPSA